MLRIYGNTIIVVIVFVIILRIPLVHATTTFSVKVFANESNDEGEDKSIINSDDYDEAADDNDDDMPWSVTCSS